MIYASEKQNLSSAQLSQTMKGPFRLAGAGHCLASRCVYFSQCVHMSVECCVLVS